MTQPSTGIAIDRLSQLFGSYKAEWLQDSLYELFSEPSYFPELLTQRPCFLIGGRGSGKTTTLRCLSYQGQQAILKKQGRSEKPSFFGFYSRINTSRVADFQGPELPDQEWDRIFGHYLNLIIAEQWCEFIEWYRRDYHDHFQIPAGLIIRIGKTFGFADLISVANLADKLDSARSEIELFLNNISSENRPTLSALGVPIDVIFSGTREISEFSNTPFFIILDEYENLLDSQQIAVNTLIKHSGKSHTFKVGVKEMGWRQRTTKNSNEQLISPADFIRIDLSERLRDNDVFSSFALAVCDQRVRQLQDLTGLQVINIKALLPELSEREEASLLGVGAIASDLRASIKLRSAKDKKYLTQMDDFHLFQLAQWAEHEGRPLKSVVSEAQVADDKWRQRFDNYGYSMLFQIKRGKVGVRKYYAGWDTYVRLAGNNIRYLLELVEQALLRSVRNEGRISTVSFEDQTVAAQQVGRKNLAELEGVSSDGGRLVRLVLGLGRIFNILAIAVPGRAPEINQVQMNFRDGSSYESEARKLVRDAVMHLAILQEPNTKASSDEETREPIYMLHPVFSPFFVYSHRRKRKMRMTDSTLVGLVYTPREAIQRAVRLSSIDVASEIPEQLSLFKRYYNDAN